jgi:hypothetical protein
MSSPAARTVSPISVLNVNGDCYFQNVGEETVEHTEVNENFMEDQAESSMEMDEKACLTNEAFVGVPVVKNQNVVPSTLIVVQTVQNGELVKLARVLFDSGGSYAVINDKSVVLPPGTATFAVENGEQTCQTITGSFKSAETLHLRDCMSPEFDRMKRTCRCKVHVFDAECNYDVALGRDFPRATCLKMVDFETNEVTWMDRHIPMKHRGHSNQMHNFFLAIADDYDFTDADEGELDDADSWGGQAICWMLSMRR